MVNKKHIETILKINGLADGAPDEEIRSVLLSARFHEAEIDTALMVLRENTVTNKTRVDGLHKVFRTDEGLEAKEIAELLGIEVNIKDRHQSSGGNSPLYNIVSTIVLWVASALVAAVAMLYYMYTHNVGVFHPSSSVIEIQ